MGAFTFEVTQELIDLIPELKEHNYTVGDILTVEGQTYSPNADSDAEANASALTDDLGTDPTKPRGKYP